MGFLRRITGLYTHRRLEAARGSVRLGRLKAPTAHCTHILPALVLLRKPLFGLPKHRIQPERYVK
jgi:hypothetical protein